MFNHPRKKIMSNPLLIILALLIPFSIMVSLRESKGEIAHAIPETYTQAAQKEAEIT